MAEVLKKRWKIRKVEFKDCFHENRKVESVEQMRLNREKDKIRRKAKTEVNIVKRILETH